MKIFLSVLGAAILIAVLRFFGIATVDESCSGLVITLVAAVAVWAFFLLLGSLPGARKLRRFAWPFAFCVAFSFVFVPHCRMASRLAPERAEFERVLSGNQCRNLAQTKDGLDYTVMDCGGALDNLVVARNHKLAADHFYGIGGWKASSCGGNSDENFEMAYLQKWF